MKDYKFLFFDKTELLSKEAYIFFKENKKFTSGVFNEFKYWRTIARSLLYGMDQMYNQTDGGMYLKDFGYFLYLPKYVVRGHKISVIRRKPNRYHYEKSFIPLCDELLSYRTEGYFRTEKKIVPSMRNIEFYDQLEENQRYLRGYYNHKDRTKYLKI